MNIDGKGLLNFLKKSRRLSAIERCSNTPHIQKYSVAEHSYYTALLSMLFADIENVYPTKRYDTSEVIKRALIHDLEESTTGDILYPFKHGNKEATELFRVLIERVVENELFFELPIDLQPYYIRLWNTSKDDTEEGKLVEAMDKLEVLLFAISEMDMGNDKAFREIYTTAIRILRENHSDIGSLMDLLDQIESEYK